MGGGGKDDLIVQPPAPTNTPGRISDGHRRPARDSYLEQRPASKKANPASVRREKGSFGVLRAIEFGGLEAIQLTNEKTVLAAAARHVGNALTFRGDG